MRKGEVSHDVLVIGGGAAGLMAAGVAAAQGKRVLLLEKNAKLGEKLAISGGGRCNILNAEEDENVLLAQYGDAKNFLFSPFSEFGMSEAYAFFESRGLPLKVEARKRAFPQSEKAVDVVRFFLEYLKEGKVDIKLRSAVENVVMKKGQIDFIVADGKEYRANSYILATGGVSHPETGSTGDGFEWLTKLGHTVHKPTPTIVPLKVKEVWVKEVSGVALPEMKISFFVEGVRKFSTKGPLLFTHFGISGPTILNAAGKVDDLLHEGAVTATIDMFPTIDLGILDKQLMALLDENKNKLLKNVFKGFAPAGMNDLLLALSTIDPEKKVHSVTKEERRILIDLLKALSITVTGLLGFEKAVVADGGVPLSEIDTKTMRSLKIENLFITGDLLHITRPSGGYSLQLCWTTGYVAGGNA
ncbi:MAG: aminoacetone oxidase family FAD-binding enzyme [Parcubacteria group bacterium]|nr:aminoacetone oxidase family FAD-binding enzyme [Parcubacteria group bacterium]